MNVVILAAGIGSRLIPFNDLPKTLTLLENGESIFSRIIKSLMRHVPVDHIYPVVGYKKEMIRECYPDLNYIVSERFEEENTAKSLLLALSRIPMQNTLWLNGDVVFCPSVLSRLISFSCTAMVVNRAQTNEEEVKWLTDDTGRIKEVSKTVQGSMGEAVGVNLIQKNDLPILIEELSLCGDNDYFEKGVEGAIARGVHVWPLEIEEGECVEVDFPEDLILANRVLSHAAD